MPRIIRRAASGATTSVAGASSTSCGRSYRSEIAYGQHSEHESLGASTSRITLSNSVNIKTIDGPTSQAPIAVKGRSKKRANASSRDGGDAEDTKPKTNRRRTAKDVDAEGKEASSKPRSPEKRGAMMRSRPPKAIVERYQRVLSQRLFMIDRQRNGNELREEFSVLGSTGNASPTTYR
ncbi:uncharacterized protein FOMMEDRAFT_157314 [Fomitiporia mediterranea MF3/22]|uniref:uncharacterized protein n=1 Tax=Fomitiporia mediterranea (strain MF3/22) TaxID=694068 RepID=UPI0004407F69|nr:uncharacterized protein FOMMEDRAFT_157314 [Fomitiporia mediterranea MF3/22]EJD02123.1 hypothetical protein FOMMEDRAFT_157314 [Fomitiporia mediterranea MF3/22]